MEADRNETFTTTSLHGAYVVTVWEDLGRQLAAVTSRKSDKIVER
jgi:hypothetical protein